MVVIRKWGGRGVEFTPDEKEKLLLEEIEKFSLLPVKADPGKEYRVLKWEVSASFPFWKASWVYEFIGWAWKRKNWLNVKIVNVLTETETEYLKQQTNLLLTDKNNTPLRDENNNFLT